MSRFGHQLVGKVNSAGHQQAEQKTRRHTDASLPVHRKVSHSEWHRTKSASRSPLADLILAWTYAQRLQRFYQPPSRPAYTPSKFQKPNQRESQNHQPDQAKHNAIPNNRTSTQHFEGNPMQPRFLGPRRSQDRP
jgi:hypothetical protein